MASGRRSLPHQRGHQLHAVHDAMQFYDDGVVQLDRAALTLRRYHFPSGTAEVIHWTRSADIRLNRWAFLMARFQLSGATRPSPLAATGCTGQKSTLVALDVPGMPGRNQPARPRPKEFIALLASYRPPPNVNPRFARIFAWGAASLGLKPQRRSSDVSCAGLSVAGKGRPVPGYR